MIFIETDSDPSTWLLMPLVWQSNNERDDWAQAQSEALWKVHEKRPKRRDVKSLAKRLVQLSVGITGNIPAHQVFLYAPDPRGIPLAFFALQAPIDGDRERVLREVVQAGEEDAIGPVQFDEFETARLGSGLRSLRYWENAGALMMTISFAWRCDEAGIDLSLRTTYPDPGWLTAQIDEIDAFAHSLWLNPDAAP